MQPTFIQKIKHSAYLFSIVANMQKRQKNEKMAGYIGDLLKQRKVDSPIIKSAIIYLEV